MRKYLGLVVGAAMAIGGGWWVLFLFFQAARIPLLLLFGAGLVTVIGCYMIWDTLKDWRKA